MAKNSIPKVRLLYSGPKDGHNKPMLRRIERAANIMLRKNWERGDCWKATGMLGSFVELHTCYNRLREMVFVRQPKPKDKRWMAEFQNVTDDLRNFCVLLEMAADANLPHGDDSETRLPITFPAYKDFVKTAKRFRKVRIAKIKVTMVKREIASAERRLQKLKMLARKRMGAHQYDPSCPNNRDRRIDTI